MSIWRQGRIGHNQACIELVTRDDTGEVPHSIRSLGDALIPVVLDLGSA